MPNTGPFSHWDPRGITTTLPASAILIAGLAAGSFFAQNSLPFGQRRTKAAFELSAAALVCVNASALLTVVQPINPHLITPPFALAAISVMVFVFAALWASDRMKAVRLAGFPLLVLGRNSLLVVILLTAIPLGTPTKWLMWDDAAAFLGGTTPLCRMLVEFTAVYLLASILYRRGWFLTQFSLPRSWQSGHD